MNKEQCIMATLGRKITTNYIVALVSFIPLCVCVLSVMNGASSR